ncbi:MAG: NAD(P)-dependent oxidoreductase [Salibacteraceae bacterium]
MIKIGVLKEGKIPVDERVPLVPKQAKSISIKDGVHLIVKRSNVRRIQDEEYESAGVEMSDAIHGQDILIGVKEVPIEELIEDKTYFFFSHTIKMQPYNRDLLKAIVEKRITLIDWECLTDAKGNRLIGFGRYAGIVGAYNGLRMIGLQENTFELRKAYDCRDYDELKQELKKVNLRPLKIILTGQGKVARGALEILEALRIRRVSDTDFLTKTYEEPVFCQITFREYFERMDGEAFDAPTFFKNPTEYQSNFMRFASVAHFFIAGHYWNSEAPFLFSREDAKNPNFNIEYVADISCDIDGPVASTIRPSTIEDPFYGYDPITETEVPINVEGAIKVMAVDNLPCELPRDASADFGDMFIKSVLPSILNNDRDGILKRGSITRNGEITDQYGYLREWISD